MQETKANAWEEEKASAEEKFWTKEKTSAKENAWAEKNAWAAEETPTRKKECRRLALGRRAALTEAERRQAEARILDRLFASGFYRQAERLLVYVSFRDEVSTRRLMEEALRQKKQVFCPRVNPPSPESKVRGEKTPFQGEKGYPSKRGMEFYQITSAEEGKELFPGPWGILEPCPSPERRYRSEDAGVSDLIILPGTAFDRERRRLGYGGGYYDRYLAEIYGTSGANGQERAHRPAVIALAFSCQIVGKLPEESTDIRPELIVTETEMIGRENVWTY